MYSVKDTRFTKLSKPKQDQFKEISPRPIVIRLVKTIQKEYWKLPEKMDICHTGEQQFE